MWSYHEDAVTQDVSVQCVKDLFNFVLLNAQNPLTETKLLHSQPLFVFCSEPKGMKYMYFRKSVTGFSFPPILRKLKTCAEALIQKELKTAVTFDAAFLNLYRSGKDSVPPHKDMTHGKEAPIVSYSFYQHQEETSKEDLRKLCIRSISKSFKEESEILMHHRSAVIMKIGMQEKYHHSVPPSGANSVRLNITFRVHQTLIKSV